MCVCVVFLKIGLGNKQIINDNKMLLFKSVWNKLML